MIVALLSDIHGNLMALEAVLGALPPVEGLWVTGDTVGYGPDPSDVLALLRERGALMVAGNHDRAVATGAGLALFNRHAADAARLHAEWLSAEERDVLASLPETAVRGAFTLCHGSLRDPLWEYMQTPGAAAASLAIADTAHGCCGHTHVPALFRGGSEATVLVRPADGTVWDLEERAFVNPGSVGQPRDGDPRASYALIDPERASVSFHRVTYAVAETQRRIRAQKLPAILADRLAHGL